MTKNLKFGYTIVYVNDVPKIIDFYNRAFGLATRMLYAESGSDYGELETGATIIGFAHHQLGKTNLPDGYQQADLNRPPLGMELVFVTEDIEATYQQAIQEGAIALSPPTDKPWGQKVAYLRDPEGTLIELCTPITPAT